MPGIQNGDITIRGYGSKESQYYTEIVATVRIYDPLAAQKFKEQYDRKYNVLGSEKVHIHLSFSQTLVRIS